MKTISISRKVIAALLAQLVPFIVNFAQSGTFGAVERAQVVGIVLTAVIGVLAPADTTETVDFIPGGVNGAQLDQMEQPVVTGQFA